MIRQGWQRWSLRVGLGVPPSTGTREALQWLMFARLGVAYSILLVLIFGRIFRPGQVDSGGELVALGLLAACFFFNLIQSIFLEKVPGYWAVSVVNILFDTTAISLWISQAAGRESFFALLYLVQTLCVSLIFFSRGAFLASVASSAALGATVWYLHVPGGLVIWLAYSTLCILLGVVGGYLSEELLRTSDSLREKSRKMEKLKALHEQIVSNLPTGLITVDSDMKVNFVNPAAEQILAMRGDALVGVPLRVGSPGLLPFFENIEAERVSDDEALGVNTGETEVSATGTEHHRSFFVRGKSQKGQLRLQQRVEIGKGSARRVLRGDVAELEVAEGLSGLLGTAATRGRVLLFQDVTTLVHLEEKLKQHEKLAAVGQLAAGIAHEIRNPLASMSASIEMLKGAFAHEEKHSENYKLMEITLKEIDRLNQLISEFLQFVRPEQAVLSSIKLSDVLAEVVVAARGTKGVVGRITFRESYSAVSAHANREKIKQVIWNLLLNAIQACSKGGGIEVGCEAVGEQWVRFWVSDSGDGMSEEVLSHLYEPFFTTKDKGTGLGLATAYKIIEAHQGEIQVRSVQGEGTRFDVLLPSG